jgi:large subunit ribosomal protein L7/L12
MADWRDEEERFDVILVDVGPRKINVIKAVRETLGLGLGEAKDFIESAPQLVKAGVSTDEAKVLRHRFEEAGAMVELRGGL